MRPESYREQVPEKRCGNCRHVVGKYYPACYCNRDPQEAGKFFVSLSFGICDHWEAREE